MLLKASFQPRDGVRSTMLAIGDQHSEQVSPDRRVTDRGTVAAILIPASRLRLGEPGSKMWSAGGTRLLLNPFLIRVFVTRLLSAHTQSPGAQRLPMSVARALDPPCGCPRGRHPDGPPPASRHHNRRNAASIRHPPAAPCLALLVGIVGRYTFRIRFLSIFLLTARQRLGIIQVPSMVGASIRK